MKILHFITNLDIGGAETFLWNLIRFTREEVEHEVVSLREGGATSQKLERLGIAVHYLKMGPSLFMKLPHFSQELIHLAGTSPDIVQTWLYHGDLLGGLFGRYVLKRPVIWSIRHMLPDGVHVTTLPVTRACAMLSTKIPDVIVSNSYTAIHEHVRYGYDANRFMRIPNGFDLEMLGPDPEGRKKFRQKWSIPEDAFVIGMLGRFDNIQKDYATLLRAFARFHERHPKSAIVLAGPGHTTSNPRWMSLVRDSGVKQLVGTSVLGIGPCHDVRGAMNALDIFTLSSVSEGFPNVVGEAMTCARPVVSSRVSDVPDLLGDEKWLFTPGDVSGLLNLWENIYSMSEDERNQLGLRNRSRIEEHFDIRTIVRSYVDLYHSLLEKNHT